MWNRLILVFWNFRKQLTQKDISIIAAGMAFFTFLSLIPMVIFVCALLPYTILTEDNLVFVIQEFIPDFLRPVMLMILAEVYEKSIGILSLSIVVVLWSAGKGMLALVRGLNAILEIEEERNYFVLRLISSIYTIVFLFSMLMALIVMVFGGSILNMMKVQEFIQGYEILLFFVRRLRFVVSWFILMIVFSLIYTYLPGKKQRLMEQLPGAAFAAIGWSILSFGFSVYISYFGGFSMYGSLSAVIIIMLWLYFCMYILLLGAYMNLYFKPVFRYFYGRRKENKQALDRKEEKH